MTLSNNLKYLRKSHGFSQDYIAEKLNYKSFTTIQKWESGSSEPPVAVLRELAKLYNISMDELLNSDLESGTIDSLPNGSLRPINYRKNIPVLGRIAAGIPITAIENVEGYEKVEDESIDFALIVKGDSMVGARIYENDIVYVSTDVDYENGDIVVALINGEDATIKRFYKYGNEIILRPENPTMKELHYKTQEVKLLGKVKEVKFKI